MAYISCVFWLSLFISGAYAAPHPGTSTSILTDANKGLFLSRKGFSLGTSGSAWQIQEDRSLSRGEPDSSWRFSNTAQPSAQAHIKTDYLKTDLTLEAYAKRWMRDYSPLGLDVMGSKVFSQNGDRGLVIDLMDTKKKIQMRQAVFMKRKRVVILTCSDTQANFDKSIQECNQLIKNFSWVETDSPQKAF